MQVSKLLEDGIKVAKLGDIPLNEEGLYFVEYINIGKWGETNKGEKEYALYDISHNLGIINSQFHFDVCDTYVNVTYVKLEM